MHTFPKGSYVKSKKENFFCKILEEIGDLRALSDIWYPDHNEPCEPPRWDQFGFSKTLIELNASYTPCTPEEAGVPREVLKIKNGDPYWYIDDCGTVYKDCWTTAPEDHFRLKVGNVYRTKEDAEAALKKILDG